ncbi:MAG: hypothetical protein AAF480_11865 [Actinomycetota bacterium]
MDRVRRGVVAMVVTWFAVVGLAALTFDYVEGDDAASISHHALGGDDDLQPTRAAYEAGADTLLGLLPADEPTLRVTGVVVTFAAAPVMLILALALADRWRAADGLRGPSTVIAGVATAAVGIAAMPEFSYLGLAYQPAVPALACLFGAHLALRPVVEGRETTWTRLLATSALFGFGASLRWDTAVYAAVIVADLVIVGGWRPRRNQVLAWIGFAAVTWAVVVLAGGGDPTGLVDAFDVGTSGRERAEERSQLQVLAGLTTVVTPGVAVLGAVGLVISPRRGSLVALAAIGLVELVGLQFSSPKLYLWLAPALLYLTALGAGHLVGLWHRWGIVAVVAVLALPWVVGLQVQRDDAAWGPGFEIQSFTRAESDDTTAVAVGAGTALPTPEGPRALGGHLWALIGGERRDLVQDLADERSAQVDIAQARGAPLVVAEGADGYLTAELARRGYRPEPYTELDGIRVRSFGGRSPSVLMVKVDDRAELDAALALAGTESRSGAVVVTAYPSGIRELHRDGMSLEPIGPTSGILSPPAASD